MEINIDEKQCLNIKEALRLEWLETNGLGGYASSTILNCHTRRYHGLLVANLTEPPGRFVLLSKFEESLLIKDTEFFLSLHKYPGTFQPLGYKYMQRFQSRPAPKFIFQIGNTIIHKTILMPQGENSVMVKYSCESSEEPLVLRLKPFLAFRDFHALSKENLSLHVRTFKAKSGVKVQPYDGMPPLFIQTNRKFTFFPSPVWYRNFEYIAEAERGFDYHEDLFHPGIFEIPLLKGDSVIITACVKECSGIEQRWESENARRAEFKKTGGFIPETAADSEDPEIMGILVSSAKSFRILQPIKKGKSRPTVVAGYHWFADWGRDTLISLPGLTFCAGDPQHGVDVLKSISKYEKNGLLPNFFSEDGRNCAYNSVDCSLWYFWAVQQMLANSGDLGTVEENFWPVMLKILDKYKKGTDHNIFMNKDGLLHAGNWETQLTWMDAKVKGKPVTPRNGYPVEINALWFNAVCFMEELAKRCGKSFNRFSELAGKIRESFNDIFWVEDGSYLGDAFMEGSLDTAVRPNQIIAVSLPYTPLDRHRCRGVVEKVHKELLTPFGLRTLSPRDRNYQGRYSGTGDERDAAYHQGTVWPWLIGHFGEAYFKVAENKGEARNYLLTFMRTFLKQHLKSAGLGYISEIFDGDPPHYPNGCIAQAWSIAEVIRLYRILYKEQRCES